MLVGASHALIALFNLSLYCFVTVLAQQNETIDDHDLRLNYRIGDWVAQSIEHFRQGDPVFTYLSWNTFHTSTHTNQAGLAVTLLFQGECNMVCSTLSIC
jgi:hypothetical protein